MDFAFNDEQEQIRATARSFAQRSLAPGYQHREDDDVIDRALVREMGELGLMAPVLDESLGGLGLDCVTMGVVVEEISRGDFNIGYLPLLAALNGQILSRHAQPEVAAEWVPKICRGEVLSALALTEPAAGSDAAHIELKAPASGLSSGRKSGEGIFANATIIVFTAMRNYLAIDECCARRSAPRDEHETNVHQE